MNTVLVDSAPYCCKPSDAEMDGGLKSNGTRLSDAVAQAKLRVLDALSGACRSGFEPDLHANNQRLTASKRAAKFELLSGRAKSRHANATRKTPSLTHVGALEHG